MTKHPLVLGHEVLVSGDVTQNRWVGARSARELERSLGYGAGCLSSGWTVLLLKQTLRPEDFKFSGLTIRSGGRLGLPSNSVEADRIRPHVSDELIEKVGAKGYRELQMQALSTIPARGEGRLVKVIPATPHSETMRPSDQYPMGGGGLQWTLIRPCRFLVAMTVDENGIARIPSFSAFLGESALYEDRAVLMRYLNEA